MPKITVDTKPVDAVSDGGNFATMPKDISHVTFYFDLTPNDLEDSEFFFVKVETPDSADDDLDTWYQDALTAILARNDQLADAEICGVAIKFGSARGGTGGEYYYAIDGDSTDVDSAPTGGLVHARDFGSYGGGASYSYDELF